jgi:hypothetical protein
MSEYVCVSCGAKPLLAATTVAAVDSAATNAEPFSPLAAVSSAAAVAAPVAAAPVAAAPVAAPTAAADVAAPAATDLLRSKQCTATGFL